MGFCFLLSKLGHFNYKNNLVSKCIVVNLKKFSIALGHYRALNHGWLIPSFVSLCRIWLGFSYLLIL